MNYEQPCNSSEVPSIKQVIQVRGLSMQIIVSFPLPAAGISTQDLTPVRMSMLAILRLHFMRYNTCIAHALCMRVKDVSLHMLNQKVS
jgi:hypothetical protein